MSPRIAAPAILAAGIAGCSCADAGPATPEMRRVRCLLHYAGAEDGFRARSGRFGPLAEMAPIIAQRPATSSGICRGKYSTLRLELHPAGYGLTASTTKQEWTRRSFLIDQPRALRESWWREPPTAASGIVK